MQIVDFHLTDFDAYHRAVPTAYAAALLSDRLCEAAYVAEEAGDPPRAARLWAIHAHSEERYLRRKAKAVISFSAWRQEAT